MSETPVVPVKETPVLRPADFRSDAYFFFPPNRYYLSGLNRQHGLKVSDSSDKYIVFATLEGVLIGAIVFTFPLMWQGGIALFIAPTLLVLAFLLPFMLFISDQDQFTERAVQKGQILLGTLESCAATVQRETYKINTVYLFDTPSGKHVRRHTTQTRPDLNGKQLPAPGTPVYVLYFNDNEYYLL